MRSIALLFAILAASSGLDYAASQITEGSDIDKQIAEWSAKKGVTVTNSARTELGIELQKYVRTNAPRAGFKSNEVVALAEGAKRSSIKLVRGGRGESGKGSAYVVVHGQASQIEVFQGPVAFFDDLLSRVGSLLEMFPNIRLVVQPVPPRDYIVEINDERYPATESGLYGVAPGTVKVRVLRGTKPPCSWAVTVARGADQVVSCNL